MTHDKHQTRSPWLCSGCLTFPDTPLTAAGPRGERDHCYRTKSCNPLSSSSFTACSSKATLQTLLQHQRVSLGPGLKKELSVVSCKKIYRGMVLFAGTTHLPLLFITIEGHRNLLGIVEMFCSLSSDHLHLELSRKKKTPG